MKKIIVCAFVLAVATVSVQAQDQSAGKHQQHKRHPHKEVFQQLGLTEDQKAKFKTLNEDFRKQVQALKKNDEITVRDWKSKMETLRKEHHTKMQGILTSEQKTKLEKMKEQRKSVRKVDDQARMDKMKIRLGLSDEQTASLKKNRTQTFEKMKALRDNKSLTDEQRKEQMKDLRKKQQEAFKSILTEEQLKKLHEKQRGPAKQPV